MTKATLVQQTLRLKPWPLVHPGDEKFFGYIVALGVIPNGWGESELTPYADFAYNDSYERYHLPEDEDLRKQLLEHLQANLDTNIGGGIYSKVWIFLTPQGYLVELP